MSGVNSAGMTAAEMTAAGAVAGSVIPGVGTIIGGAIGAGTSLIAGILNYFENKSANKKNYNLALLTSKNTLAAQQAQNEFNAQQIALNKKQQAFQEAEAEKNRQTELEKTGYSRIQGAYQRGADLLTTQMNMDAVKAAPFIRGK